MAIEHALLTWVHLISASIWVGGSLFLGVVLAPILRKMSMPIEERLEFMIKVGKKFNKIALPSLIILIGTGLYQSHLVLNKQEILFDTTYGQILVIKILLVIALIITFAVHIRTFNNNIERKIVAKEMTDNQLKKLNKKGMILGEVTVTLSIIILLLAAMLDAGI